MPPDDRIKKPDESLEALGQAMGALGIEVGHEIAAHDEGIRDGCHTNPPIDAVHKWIGVKDDDVRLALKMDLRDGIKEGGGCGGGRKDSEGEGELHGSPRWLRHSSVIF